MEFTEEEKQKISKLPKIFQMGIEYLKDVMATIIRGDCDESTMLNSMGTLNQNAQGRYSDADLCTYDDAAKAMGFPVTARKQVSQLLFNHGVRPIVIKNRKMGFNRFQVLALRDKLHGEIYLREQKRQATIAKTKAKEKILKKKLEAINSEIENNKATK